MVSFQKEEAESLSQPTVNDFILTLSLASQALPRKLDERKEFVCSGEQYRDDCVHRDFSAQRCGCRNSIAMQVDKQIYSRKKSHVLLENTVDFLDSAAVEPVCSGTVSLRSLGSS